MNRHPKPGCRSPLPALLPARGTPRVEPHTLPRPDTSPELLIDHLARAFHPRAATTEPAFRVLHAHLAQDAALNGEKPARDFPAFFAARRRTLAPLADPAALIPLGSESNSYEATVHTLAVSTSGRARFINFHLAAPKPNRWRITNVITQLDSS